MAVELSISAIEMKPKPNLYDEPVITQIMIVLGEWEWTFAAVCIACVLARRVHGTLILVEMIPVQHPSWLGTPLADLHRKEYLYLPELEATMQGYGIPYEVQAFHSLSSVEAIVQAAERYKAHIVFARVVSGLVLSWDRFQEWRLRKRLEHDHRQFYASSAELISFLWPSPVTKTYRSSSAASAADFASQHKKARLRVS